jgi:release factor glutamine methyltransferase
MTRHRAPVMPGRRGPTVAEALEGATATLRTAGVEQARVDAEWLLAETLGISRGRLALQGRQALEPPTLERYAHAVRRRSGREPLQHIVGTQAFRELTLVVSGAALVPRPETELLAGWAIELLAGVAAPVAIDLGTGAGCIACALAAECARARVIALDVSPDAVALAGANVDRLDLAGRVRVVVSDLFGALAPMRADLIVANPPYLPSGTISSLPPEVRQHDPRLALDGGPDGLDVIRRIVDEAPRWLAPAGRLLLETAGEGQVAAVGALLAARGFATVETRRDLAGVVRFVSAGLHSPTPAALRQTTVAHVAGGTAGPSGALTGRLS